MTKVYIEPYHIPELPFSLVFWPSLKFPLKESRVFLREIMAQYQEPFFAVVTTPKEADFFAVPFEFFFVLDGYPEYLERVYASAQAHHKKVLLFDYSDYVDRVPTLPPHAVLFRVSVYRHHQQPGEIVMPYFVEDLGARYAITPREKTKEPKIGYCGQADFATLGRHFRAVVKRSLAFLSLIARFDTTPSVHTRGIFWRQRVLRVLKGSGLPLEIIARRFYSLHRKSGSFDPERIRTDYVENLRTSDLALCVRGDANASQRFYETLSASRIPLFIDTDCVLPLEEVISYHRIVLRISWDELATLPACVRLWYDSISPESFLTIEREGRVVYDEYLRLDRFFALVFDRERSPYKQILFS